MNEADLRRAVLAVLLIPCLAAADPPRLDPAGIPGALVLTDGPPSAAALDRFAALAGGKKGRAVIITLGGPGPRDKKSADALGERLAEVATVSVEGPGGAEMAEKALDGAGGAWLEAADAARALPHLRGGRLEKALRALLARGGVIGAWGPTAALGDLTPTSKGTVPGVGLLPGCIVGDAEAAPGEVLAAHKLVGVGLSPGSALLIRGRELRALDGAVTLRLAAGPDRPARTDELKAGAVSDLTLWRRAAVARAERPPWPPKEPPVPEVPSGSLVIVGGGGMPADVTKRFIALAGGPDALIVVLPTANPDPVPLTEGGFFQRAGAKNVKVLPARELKDVEDPKNLAVLKEAKGVWFGGGRQWRFVDAYENTRAHDAFRDVLKRGGVIGGSSAGATIQGDYLVRGSPLGNTEMMCEGYERGLGFLPGVGIDQHFAQRKRFADMTSFVKRYPQFLGIGLDEATVIVVKGHVAEVMGRGEAHFYDRRKPVEEGKPDHESLKAGAKYDLKARKALSEEK
jgi:cyanophycinase